MNPLVVDLSHWDPAQDYNKVKAAGIVGVIFKASDDTDYEDPTYMDQRSKALSAGLLWGAYHFGRVGDISKQVSNFLNYARIGNNDLFCLDWEENPSGATMSSAMAKEWIVQTETRLGRPSQCLIYSGNVAKEQLGSKVDPFFGMRRLWLAQYSNTAVVQASWKTYWLWQYTDGQVGPEPHTIPGIGHCDINHYDGNAEQLRAEWATGKVQVGPKPPVQIVTITVEAPEGVSVVVNRKGSSNGSA